MSVFHSRPENCDALSWEALGEVDVCAPALVDVSKMLGNGRPMFARLNYDECLAVAKRLGGAMLSQEQLLELRDASSFQLLPFLGTPRAETEESHCRAHDEAVWRQLDELGWAPGRGCVAGAGKHWLAGAPAGKSKLGGWDKDGAGPGSALWQPVAVAHNRLHFDDGTTSIIVRPRGRGWWAAIKDALRLPGFRVSAPVAVAVMDRPTIDAGDTGEHVLAWQQIIGAAQSGVFDARTVELTKDWQRRQGLVADGIVGAKSWIAAGQRVAAPPAGKSPSPACLAALRDASLRWPTRSKRSDGIIGDARHQATKSDHNDGNAVDITHDPASGCDGNLIAAMAMTDARTKYVIWDREIWSRARAGEGWRPYSGSNPHTHHCHISIEAETRSDGSPWPWRE